jgi:uncharacterized membrane protein required for colicin V production
MNTLAAFASMMLGFVPFLTVVAILIALFWVATKAIPSLGEWMTSTKDMPDADDYIPYAAHVRSTTYDQYV